MTKTIGDRIKEIQDLSLDFSKSKEDRRAYSHQLYCAFPEFNIHGDQVQFSYESDYMSLKEAQEVCLEMYKLLFPTRPVVTIRIPKKWPSLKPPKGMLTEAQTKRMKKSIAKEVKECRKHFDTDKWPLDFDTIVGNVFMDTFGFHLSDAVLFALQNKRITTYLTEIEGRTMLKEMEDVKEDNKKD